MAKRVQCFHCKQAKPQEEMMKVLRHNICRDCYDAYTSTQEYKQEKLIDDIWNLYKDKPPYHQIVAQVNELKERYGFTLEGMTYALHHYLKFNEWNTNYYLYQAFPKAYYEARDYYQKQKKIKASITNREPKIKTVISRGSGDIKPLLPI